MEIVFVEWNDSVRLPDRWMPLEEARKLASQNMWISTVGYVVEETDEYVVIARSCDDQIPPNVDGSLQIPKKMIRGWQKLEKIQHEHRGGERVA